MIEIRSNGSPSKLELIVNGVPAQEGDEFSFIRLPNSTSIDVKDHRLSDKLHLKSQLAIAHAVVQAKNATIDAQHFTIIQQQRLLSGEVIIDSLKRVSPRPKDDDSERVLGGIAEITKYEGKGFNVNLPEIYRRLRRLFNDE